jgi:hypothetical protein
LVTPVSKHVPELDIKALCKSRSAADKIMRMPQSQSVADCVIKGFGSACAPRGAGGSRTL